MILTGAAVVSTSQTAVAALAARTKRLLDSIETRCKSSTLRWPWPGERPQRHSWRSHVRYPQTSWLLSVANPQTSQLYEQALRPFRSRGGSRGPRGLVAARWRNQDQRAKQAVLLVEGAGREEEGRRRSRAPAVAEGQRPEPVNRERLAIGAMERAAGLELTGAREARGVEGVEG
jgi:hypothetical protein